MGNRSAKSKMANWWFCERNISKFLVVPGYIVKSERRRYTFSEIGKTNPRVPSKEAEKYEND